MIDKAKAILGLIIAIVVLIGYIVRLEHRLTVIEQQQCAANEKMDIRLENIDDNQRRLMQHLFFE